MKKTMLVGLVLLGVLAFGVAYEQPCVAGGCVDEGSSYDGWLAPDYSTASKPECVMVSDMGETISVLCEDMDCGGSQEAYFYINHSNGTSIHDVVLGVGDSQTYGGMELYVSDIFCGAGDYHMVEVQVGYEAEPTPPPPTPTPPPPPPPPIDVFDIGPGTWPSIYGTHRGTITLVGDLTVSKMYTYNCSGTAGHSEYVHIWGNGVDVTGVWGGYLSDNYHVINFPASFILEAGKVYDFEIRTGSYPQIIHKHSHTVDGGTMTYIDFIDAYGQHRTDWLPAIKLYD